MVTVQRAVSNLSMVVAQTQPYPPMDSTMKAVVYTQPLVVVLTTYARLKAKMRQAVAVQNHSSAVVRMERQQHGATTLRDVVVPIKNLDAAR